MKILGLVQEPGTGPIVLAEVSGCRVYVDLGEHSESGQIVGHL